MSPGCTGVATSGARADSAINPVERLKHFSMQAAVCPQSLGLWPSHGSPGGQQSVCAAAISAATLTALVATGGSATATAIRAINMALGTRILPGIICSNGLWSSAISDGDGLAHTCFKS
jgi:hypothetical protein